MLRLEGEMRDSKELNNLIVGSSKGSPIYLHNVASVVDTVKKSCTGKLYQRPTQCHHHHSKQTGANSVNIVDAVKERLPELTKIYHLT